MVGRSSRRSFRLSARNGSTSPAQRGLPVNIPKRMRKVCWNSFTGEKSRVVDSGGDDEAMVGVMDEEWEENMHEDDDVVDGDLEERLALAKEHLQREENTNFIIPDDEAFIASLQVHIGQLEERFEEMINAHERFQKSIEVLEGILHAAD